MDTFYQDNCMEDSQSSLSAVVSEDYVKSVLNLIYDERNYIRDLHMIIKIFREEIAKLVQDEHELEMLFSNITDIYEITATLLDSLENAMEIEEERQMPTVGLCFEELAEAAEFDVYIKYARDVNSPANRESWTNLLSRPESNVILRVASYSIRDTVKYYLPKLLLQPVWHCFLYFDYIEVLHKYTPSIEDRKTLERVQDLLKPLQMELMQCVASIPKKDTSLAMQSRVRRQVAIEEIKKLQKTVDGWDDIDIRQYCNELFRQDTLKKVNRQKLTKRKALLFDELLILCKPTSRRVYFTFAAINAAIREDSRGTDPTHREQLKEIFFIKKVDIIDKEDTEELKHAFEIVPRDHSNVLLLAKSVEDKSNWMADLVMLNTKNMLERILNNILLEDQERKYPLRLPPVHLYKFAEQDSKDNIVLEARCKNNVPLIKGATLIKLIERLTYHAYADPVFVRTFLITYRSFCSPQELLTLLIERFNIPDPSTVYGEEDKLSWKRYKKDFCQPVQLRVLNVLRHWVNYHFYDFERDEILLERLQVFLSGTRFMRKWVESLIKIVQRKCKPFEQRPITHIFGRPFPRIKTHLTIPENNEEYGILTIHPIEFARQLTLLEFDMFRLIKPSELIGCVWTKEDKEKTSPNLMKMIKHTTNFTRWLEKIIVEAQNFEERVAIVSRAIEIMIMLKILNNFNGVLAIVSAMDSASVYRLKFTFQSLSAQLEKALQDARELNYNHFRKYQEKLRFINPPCVPFLGMYLTNILHIEEGNSKHLPGSLELINFSKLRKVAKIIDEIQQYQSQPYCLLVESKIKQYIESICPFDSNMSDDNIDTYLYNRSLLIEPREYGKPVQFPRKWAGINLKSPGIKIKIVKRSRNLLPILFHRMISKCEIQNFPSMRLGASLSDETCVIGMPTSLSYKIFSNQLSPSLRPGFNKEKSLLSQRLQWAKKDIPLLSLRDVILSPVCSHSAVYFNSMQPPVSTDVDFYNFKKLLTKISCMIEIMTCKLYDINIEYSKLKSSIELSDPERTLDQFRRIVHHLVTVVNDIFVGHYYLERDLLILKNGTLY